VAAGGADTLEALMPEPHELRERELVREEFMKRERRGVDRWQSNVLGALSSIAQFQESLGAIFQV
jgi:hypothetical protein